MSDRIAAIRFKSGETIIAYVMFESNTQLILRDPLKFSHRFTVQEARYLMIEDWLFMTKSDTVEVFKDEISWIDYSVNPTMVEYHTEYLKKLKSPSSEDSANSNIDSLSSLPSPSGYYN